MLLPAVPDAADRRAVLAGLARTALHMGKPAAARVHLNDARGAPETLAPVWAEVGGAAAVEDLLNSHNVHADPAARRAVLMELAEAHAREGATGAAVEAAEAVQERRYQAITLARVAGITRRADLLERAEEVANGISLPFARAFAFSIVADAWLALDRPDRALTIAQGIDKDALAVTAFDLIARHPAADPATARQAKRAADDRLDSMVDRVARVRLWAARAGALAHTDSLAAAQAARLAVTQALAIRDRWSATHALLHAAEAATALQTAGVEMSPLDSRAQDVAKQ